jgi:hypothetical protein
MPNKINLDIANRVDITCRKGDTFELDIDIKDSAGVAIDLTSYTFKMEVRETDTSSDVIIFNSSFSFTGDASGNLTVTASAATMEAIDSGMYVYDLQSTYNGVVKTWLYGLFIINEDITV